jgi:hypothetical protein
MVIVLRCDLVRVLSSTRPAVAACRASGSAALDLESEGEDTGQLIEGKDAVGAVISWRMVKECPQEGRTLRKQN